MSKSKKERKREKVEQKEQRWKPPALKLHHQEFQIPPYTQEHAKALVLECLAYEVFEIPVHHIKIYERMKTFYQNFQNADVYMKDLDFPDVLRDLQKMYLIVKEDNASKHRSAPSGPNW